MVLSSKERVKDSCSRGRKDLEEKDEYTSVTCNAIFLSYQVFDVSI